jgi:hypothetical protein
MKSRFTPFPDIFLRKRPLLLIFLGYFSTPTVVLVDLGNWTSLLENFSGKVPKAELKNTPFS